MPHFPKIRATLKLRFEKTGIFGLTFEEISKLWLSLTVGYSLPVARQVNFHTIQVSNDITVFVE